LGNECRYCSWLDEICRIDSTPASLHVSLQILEYHIITGANDQGTGLEIYEIIQKITSTKNGRFTTPTMAGADKSLTLSIIPKKNQLSSHDSFGMIKIEAVGSSAFVQRSWFYPTLMKGGNTVIHVIDAVLLPIVL
jgi:uncharacterized surface protein with fasciclin (FAS1) repeats